MSRIVEARIWPLEGKLRDPIRVSFGEMQTRPGLLVSLKDDMGHVGWGESWVNFPIWGLYERTMTLFHLLKDIVGQDVLPNHVAKLYTRYLPQVIQSGGIGPFSQALSAIDCALWDLEAKRQGVPLYNALGASTVSGVSVYASGIDPAQLESRVPKALEDGFTNVKIKVGFDISVDRERFLSASRMTENGRVMVDSNQKWDRVTAERELEFYLKAGALWVEEPVSALDLEGYYLLSSKYQGIAAGENWYLPTVGDISPIRLYVFQPDLCKVGGLWALDEIVRRGPQSVHGVALHVLGNTISHSFALHVALARDVVTYVEMDTNENPLAEACSFPWFIHQGTANWTNGNGLGVDVDEEMLERWLVKDLSAFVGIQSL